MTVLVANSDSTMACMSDSVLASTLWNYECLFFSSDMKRKERRVEGGRVRVLLVVTTYPLLGSSKTRTGLLRKSVRPRQKSFLCPWDKKSSSIFISSIFAENSSCRGG